MTKSALTILCLLFSPLSLLGQDCYLPKPCLARTTSDLFPDPWLVPISTITGNNGTGTVNVTTSHPHGLSTGQQIYISGVYTGTVPNGQTDFNTFFNPVTITVDSTTSFHYAGTFTSSATNSGYVVTQPRPIVNQVFNDPMTGERGVRATCKESILATLPAGSDCGPAGPNPNSEWASGGGALHMWNTNSGATPGMMSVLCPQDGTCWHPGQYNFYIDMMSGPNLRGGGAILGVFDPATMRSQLIKVADGRNRGGALNLSGSAWWSHSDPDILYYVRSPKILSLNVQTNALTTIADYSTCGTQPPLQSTSHGAQLIWVSGDDRYFAYSLGGVNVGTPNEFGVQDLLNMAVVYDTQTSYCYWYNTFTGMQATYDSVHHTYIEGPSQVLDPYNDNAPTGQTSAPPAPKVTAVAGSLAAGTYWVRVTSVVTISGTAGAQVETLPSPPTSIALDGSQGLQVTAPPPLPSTAYDEITPRRYKIYGCGPSPTDCGVQASHAQTPYVFGPNKPSATATSQSGGTLSGSYDIQISYHITVGGQSNTGGESNASNTPTCLSVAAANNAIQVPEPSQLDSRLETQWSIYIAANSGSCSNVNPRAYHRVGTFNRGSGTQIILTNPTTGTSSLNVELNATGAIATSKVFQTPSEWTSLLAATEVPPAQGSAGFGQHGFSLSSNGQWLKVGPEEWAPYDTGTQQFDVWWNIGTTDAGLCGNVSGPDHTSNTVCGGHPANGYNYWATNHNTSGEPMAMYLRKYTDLTYSLPLNAPPAPTPLHTEDMHQGWQFNPGTDLTPFCYDNQNVFGDDWNGSNNNYYASGWGMAVRRAGDNEFVCTATDGSGNVYRMFKTHSSSYGSLLKANPTWISAISQYGVSVLATCRANYDGKYAMCAGDWYGTEPTINGKPVTKSNTSGIDIYIYELK